MNYTRGPEPPAWAEGWAWSEDSQTASLPWMSGLGAARIHMATKGRTIPEYVLTIDNTEDGGESYDWEFSTGENARRFYDALAAAWSVYGLGEG